MSDADAPPPERSEKPSGNAEAPVHDHVAQADEEATSEPYDSAASRTSHESAVAPNVAEALLHHVPPVAKKYVLPPKGDPLTILRWVAPFGVFALILGRFVGPAVPGVGVGMATLVRSVEVLGGAFSLSFGVALIVGLFVVLAHSTTHNVPPWMRFFGMAISAFAAFVVLVASATGERVMESAALFGSFAAGVFAILAALSARGTRIVRLPALALGLVGAAALTRSLRGLLWLYGTPLFSAVTLTSVGRVATTAATVFVGLASIFVLVYIGRNSRSEANSPKEGASLWTPATLVVLVLAVVCARQAAAGSSPDAGFVSIVLKRASDRFLLQPEPFVRGPLRLFLGFLTPLAAAGALSARRVPSLAAALSLVMISADVTDAPIGGAVLMLASLGILMVARSGHALWSTLVASAVKAAPQPNLPASY